MRNLQIATYLAVLWFAISFGLLGFWILLCLMVRMQESNKMRRHFGYMTRRRDLQNLYRKELDEKPVQLDPAVLEALERQHPNHPDGTRCFGYLCYCGTRFQGVLYSRPYSR